MFTVNHVVVGGEKDEGEYGVKNLLLCDQNMSRSDELRPWFDASSSLVWTPAQLPPTCPFTDDPSGLSVQTCGGTEEFPTRHHSVLSSSKKDGCNMSSEEVTMVTAGTSPVLKRMLQKDTNNCSVVDGSPMVEWCSCPVNEMLFTPCGNESEKEALVKELGKKAEALGLHPNHRGKWVIFETDVNNRSSLGGLWKDITEQISKGLVQQCNSSFQTDPPRIVIYTDFLDCFAIPERLQCIREQVEKMSYVVHPHGEVLSWNGEEVVLS